MTVATITLNPSIDKTFTVDHVVPDRKLACENVQAYPGGGGINVARVVRRLGGEVQALWSCGGETGMRLGRLLDAEAVPHTPVAIEGAVRENLIAVDAASGEQYRFCMPGPLLSPRERSDWLARVRSAGASLRFIVFSGSLPKGVSGEWYRELLQAVPRGVRVIVDTKREALRTALETGVYLVKPNVSELSDLTGQSTLEDEQIAQAARSIIEQGGAEVVLVSLGRGGALLLTEKRTVRFAAPAVPIASKVGAGDSMVGGLVYALAQNRPLEEAVRLGIAAGSAAVMTPGTELCRAQDALRLERGVLRQTAAA